MDGFLESAWGIIFIILFLVGIVWRTYLWFLDIDSKRAMVDLNKRDKDR